jgi:quercetin dioxygenase-like cupin family protein
MTRQKSERLLATDKDGAPLAPPPIDGNHSKVLRHVLGSAGSPTFTWKDVPLEPYKKTTETWKGISRRELIGKRGETPRFHVRYFEVDPGGYSTLEKHEHEHVVVGMRGRGEAQIGCYIHTVGFGDVVYVSPSDPHQFSCPEDASEPFGFLCLVNAERDKPEAVDGLGACYVCG